MRLIFCRACKNYVSHALFTCSSIGRLKNNSVRISSVMRNHYFNEVPGCYQWVIEVSCECAKGSFQIEKNVKFTTVS